MSNLQTIALMRKELISLKDESKDQLLKLRIFLESKNELLHPRYICGLCVTTYTKNAIFRYDEDYVHLIRWGTIANSTSKIPTITIDAFIKKYSSNVKIKGLK